jgi:hypothetical protein
MRVLMVFVVHVAMLVLDQLVAVLVFVAFSPAQQTPTPIKRPAITSWASRVQAARPVRPRLR